MAQKLTINCATCDARNVQEENYAHYEQISVNCAVVLTNAGSKAVLNRLPFALNCASVLEMEENVDVRTINGACEIKSSDTVPASQYYMLVNGSLTIGPNTQEQLSRCVGMTIHGSLICPESIYPLLTGVKVSGATVCYPDEAIVLKPNAFIDKLFMLRAKNKLYWSGRRMIMVDPELDADTLRCKGVSFRSEEVIIAQSKLEPFLDLIDENAQLIVVPDGTIVVTEDITLDRDTLRRYGNRLYIIGDVTVSESPAVLDQLKYLNIRGDVTVPQPLKEKLMTVLNELSGEMHIARPKGADISDKPLAKITRWMLEQQPSGIEVSDCAVVKIADDIPKELIVQRLHITDCGIVKCCEELEDAVTMVCTDVGQIGNVEDGASLGDMLNTALGAATNAMETKVVNAAEYVL